MMTGNAVFAKQSASSLVSDVLVTQVSKAMPICMYTCTCPMHSCNDVQILCRVVLHCTCLMCFCFIVCIFELQCMMICTGL